MITKENRGLAQGIVATPDLLGVGVAGLSPEEAAGHFGLFAVFASIDVPASSARTRQEFGWQPVHPGLIADLDEGHYFKEA